MRAQDYQISAEKFVFRSKGAAIHDQKLETKPVGYMRDAFNRFTRNKGSIVAFFVIMLLVLFSIFGPVISPYAVSYGDKNYDCARPKIELMQKLGIPFWDGGRMITKISKSSYDYYRAIEQETGAKVIMDSKEVEIEEIIYMKKAKTNYTFRLDTYTSVGADFINLSDEEYQALQKYQDDNNLQIILPFSSSKSVVLLAT